MNALSPQSRRRNDQRVLVIQRASSYHNHQNLATGRRSKQASANSLDDFWSGLDEMDFARSPVPRNHGMIRGSRIKQLSSQTARTGKSSMATEEWDIIQIRGSKMYSKTTPPVSEISFQKMEPVDVNKVSSETPLPSKKESDTKAKMEGDTKATKRGFFRRVFGRKGQQ